MKILVTGSTGFVGSHLCERLKEKGHDVYSLARSEEKFNEFEIPGKMILGSLNPNGGHKWMNQLPDDLDAVVHTAGIVHSYNKQDFIDVNTSGTRNLIEDLKEKFPKLKFVLISSLAATGPAENLMARKEEHHPKPNSEYGRSKLMAETELKKAAPAAWEQVVIRPPMVIGPRDPAVLDIFKMVKSGVVLMAGLNGKKKQYSYVCVFDLVEVIVKSVETSGLNNEIFFAAHEQQLTLEELISVIKKKMNKKRTLNVQMPMPVIKTLAHTLEKLHKIRPIDYRLTPDKINELSPKAWTCDSEKSKSLLKMEYSWDIENTIEVTLEDYQSRGWI